MAKKTVFIGGGNMAEALLSGMIEAGELPPGTTWVTDPREERLNELSDRFGVQTATTNRPAAEDADVVWLCVKPQQMPAVLDELAPLPSETLVVSIAAGVSIGTLREGLGGSARVVRVMPNTPALVKQGAAGVAAGPGTTEEDMRHVLRALRCVGKAREVEEQALHAVTAISGSGPAYLFTLCEAMLSAADTLGLDAETARELAVQTLGGAARLLEESGDPPELLRERVTSKGGTTAAALAAFSEAGVQEGLRRGILAAARRSGELAGE